MKEVGTIAEATHNADFERARNRGPRCQSRAQLRLKKPKGQLWHSEDSDGVTVGGDEGWGDGGDGGGEGGEGGDGDAEG